MENSRISRVGQIKVYLGKCFRIFVYEKGWKVLVFTAIISVIISGVLDENTFVNFQETKSGVFTIVCAAIWIGIFNSIQSICREREIIKREYKTGLHISSYIMAHMIYEFVICLVEAAIMLLALAVFNGNIPDHGVVLNGGGVEMYVTFFLVIYCADILGMAVSSIVKSEKTAMTVMPFILIVQLVLCGMFFPLEGVAVGISNLTISKWGMEAIGSTADMNNMQDPDTLMRAKYEIEYKGEVDLYELIKDQEYRHEFEASVEHISSVWFILVGYTVLYGVVCVVALKFIEKDKR